MGFWTYGVDKWTNRQASFDHSYFILWVKGMHKKCVYDIPLLHMIVLCWCDIFLKITKGFPCIILTNLSLYCTNITSNMKNQRPGGLIKEHPMHDCGILHSLHFQFFFFRLKVSKINLWTLSCVSILPKDSGILKPVVKVHDDICL